MTSQPLSRITISHYLKSDLPRDLKRNVVTTFLADRKQHQAVEQLILPEEPEHQDRQHVFIVMSADQIIGLADILLHEGQATLRRFLIAEGFRQQALGSKLMLHLFGKMHELGIERISAYAQDCSRRFFEQLGFVETQKHGHAPDIVYSMQHNCPQVLATTHLKPETKGKLIRLQSPLQLGRDTERYHFHNENEFVGLHRTILPQARRRIWIMTDNLQCKILSDESTGATFLKLIKGNPNADIRLLIDNDKQAAGYYNPLVTLTQRLSSHIEIRTFPQSGTQLNEVITLVDHQGSVHRNSLSDFTGTARFNCRIQNERLSSEFLQHWQVAKPSVELRRLAI